MRARLVERGASAEVVAYVGDVLVSQHQRYHAWMAAEADKRRTLLGLVRSLEARPRPGGVLPKACMSRQCYVKCKC